VREWLFVISEPAIAAINMLALVVVVGSTLEAFFSMCYLLFTSPSRHDWRHLWLRYARWLVAALTFQLAADIIETSITTGWEALGRIAIIAIIRTFLNYFLEKDLAEVGDLQREQQKKAV
jgi:uncharacterized membrane protein